MPLSVEDERVLRLLRVSEPMSSQALRHLAGGVPASEVLGSLQRMRAQGLVRFERYVGWSVTETGNLMLRNALSADADRTVAAAFRLAGAWGEFRAWLRMVQKLDHNAVPDEKMDGQQVFKLMNEKLDELEKAD